MTGPSGAGVHRAEPRQHLDDFDILDKLGEGASAEVYHAHNLTFDVTVALKLWRRPLTPDQTRKFLDECRLHFRLADHPNIVRLYWAEAPDGARPWLATEVCDLSLAERLRQQPPLSPLEADLIAEDILGGLAAIHDLHHLHRDIKPANVLLKRGRALLCDMGIAMHADAHTRDGAAGSTYYLAPELEHTATPTYRSDVYSAAMTLRALLPQPRNPALDALITRATSTNPDDRPADGGDLHRRYMTVRTQPVHPIATNPPQTPSADPLPADPGAAAPANRPAGRRAGPRRHLLLASAAVAAAALTVAAVLAYRTLPSTDPPGTRSQVTAPRATQIGTPATRSAQPSHPATTGTPASRPATTTTHPSPNASPRHTDHGYVTASSFTPFGTTFASFPYAAAGTNLTIGSPSSYEHLWGAWLPGNRCISRASFDIQLDPPNGASVGYGYAVAPTAEITGDQPTGWSLQHEWDGPNNGFYTRPVLLPDGAGAAGDSTPAPDVRTRHTVTATANASTYTVTIDGASRGTFSGPAQCGGLAIRVWGGATAHLDHIVISQ